MSQNWGQARVEIDGLQDEISKELEFGRSVKSIYNALKSAGRVSVTYKAFRVRLNCRRESSKKHAPASWGRARAEVIALRSEIRAGLAAGRTLKEIHSELKAAGRVSGSYKGFYKNVRKFCGSPKPRPAAIRASLRSDLPVPLQTVRPARAAIPVRSGPGPSRRGGRAPAEDVPSQPVQNTRGADLMTTVNLILQGKGGVGKSFVATLLAEHYKARGTETVCIDTDPVNATFSGYPAYAVRRLEILDADKNVDPEKFDGLVEAVMDAPKESVVIVDNGAATFVPLCAYLVEDGAVAVLTEAGHEVKFHTVVTGGAGLRDTMSGLDDLCASFPGVPVVVWRNEFFGPVKGANGARFEDFKVCKDHRERIHAVITIPARNPATLGRNLGAMHGQRLSFGEAAADPGFSVMARQRLAMYRRDMDERMKAANL